MVVFFYFVNAFRAGFPGSRLCAIACPGSLWAWRQELSMSQRFCELVSLRIHSAFGGKKVGEQFGAGGFVHTAIDLRGMVTGGSGKK